MMFRSTSDVGFLFTYIQNPLDGSAGHLFLFIYFYIIEQDSGGE